jgi:hypothetical protein
LRCIQQFALVADARQEEPGAVAHGRRGLAINELRKDLGRLLVQAVGQQHAAAQHLGFVVMRRHAAEVLRDHQARDRAEVAVLVEVEERVAVVRCLHGFGRRRGLGSRQTREQGQKPEGTAGSGHCQVLTSNSGCSLASESLMRSSM